MPRPHARILGRGNNGAVVRLRPGPQVCKWTVDPVEVQTTLAVQSLREAGEPLPGLPEIHDIRLGDREALIVRDDVHPAGHWAGWMWYLPPKPRRNLQMGGRLVTGAPRPERLSASRRPSRYRRGILLQNEALCAQELRDVYDVVLRLEEVYGFRPLDLRPSNILPHGGRRDRGLVLMDGGRSPIETLTVAPGEAYRRCPNETALTQAVHRLLGVRPSYGRCQIAGPHALREVMRKHGWRDEEIDGTAGFHTEGKPGDILIRRGDEWSVLHELVHAAGVVDKGMATWLCEAITEGAAQDIAKAQGIPHHPTYPAEVELVREKFLPALQAQRVLPAKEPMLALARLVLRNPKAATERLVEALRAELLGARALWYAAVGPDSPGVEAAALAIRRGRDNFHMRALRRRRDEPGERGDRG